MSKEKKTKDTIINIPEDKGIFTLEEVKKLGITDIPEDKGIWTREEVEKILKKS